MTKTFKAILFSFFHSFGLARCFGGVLIAEFGVQVANVSLLVEISKFFRKSENVTYTPYTKKKDKTI